MMVSPPSPSAPPAILRTAARRAVGESRQMDAMVAAIESGAPADVPKFVEIDRDFHEILANTAGNRVLALAHEPVTSLFIPAGQIILPRLKTYRRVLDAHRYIFKCLRYATMRVLATGCTSTWTTSAAPMN